MPSQIENTFNMNSFEENAAYLFKLIKNNL